MSTAQMTLSSPAFKDMEPLPLKYTQTGTRPSIVVSPGMNNAAVNPPIEWSNVPRGDKRLCPDAVRPCRHADVAVVNIPVTSGRCRGSNTQRQPILELPAGAFHRSFRSNGLDQPAARQNPEGRWTYYWKLYPLDKKLNLPEDASREDILIAMEGHLTGNKAVMITPCCDGSK